MAIVFTITDAGRAALVDPDHNGTNAVVIAEVGLGSGRYAPAKDQTELEAPIKRVDTIAGQAVSDDTLHVTVQDETGDAYQVGEIGLFTDAGVLFAVYSQSDWIIEKAAPATLLLATDLVVESLDVSSITFGNAAFLNPPASTTVKGVLELATQEEVDAGSDRIRAVVPRTLKAFIDKVLKAYATVKQLTDHAASRDHPAANTNNQGMIELATYAEAKEGKDNSRAVTPAGGKAALDQHRQETGAHAADRISLGSLSKLGDPKTVQAALTALGSAALRDEGSGGRLDADTVDGIHASDFMRSDTHTQMNVGRGQVYVENHDQDNQDGAGITLRTASNPSNGSPGNAGAIFAIRSSGDALRLWVGQSVTSTGDNDFETQTLRASGEIYARGNNKAWHTGNFDPSSKLGNKDKAVDSNKLNGLFASQFMRQDEANDVLRLTNKEAGEYTDDGTLLFDHSNGLYLYMTAPPLGGAGAYSVMTAATVKAGSGIKITGGKGKDSVTTIEADIDVTTDRIENAGGAYLRMTSNGNLDMHDGSGYIFRVNASGRLDRAAGGIDANLLNISLGGVGSYALMLADSGGVDPGNTVSGSRLRYASCNGDKRGSSPSGTWRLMGCLNNSDGDASDSTSLYLRIS